MTVKYLCLHKDRARMLLHRRCSIVVANMMFEERCIICVAVERQLHFGA